MSTRTLPRLPLTRRERAGADGVDNATTTTDALSSAGAPTGAVLAVTQAPRMRRVATIVVIALVLSALATGAAVALARRGV